MGPCEMPLIEFIVAEEEDYKDEDGEDYYEGEGDLDDETDVAMEEGCTAACQDILGWESVASYLNYVQV